MHITNKLLLASMSAVVVAVSVFARDFTLNHPRTSTLFGPYRFQTGARARLGGVPFEIKIHDENDFSFKSLSDGKVFGPFQAVPNRLVKIEGEIYVFNWDHNTVEHAVPVKPVKSAAEKAYEADSAPIVVPDLPPEPEKPTRLEIPEDQHKIFVPPKNLADLPDPSESLEVLAWLAFVDTTPIDWEINSKKGKKTEIDRVTLGGDINWNCWRAQIALSPSVKSGGIVPTDDGDAKIDSGSGWLLALGYDRPFLLESGWSVNAGIHGMIRQDKGDLVSDSYVIDSQADTNGVYSMSMKHASSSVTLTEMSLWVDLGLSYTYDSWCIYGNFSFEPFSEYDVSGDLLYGGTVLELDAERNSPISMKVGGWYLFGQYRFFADMTFFADMRFRIGCGFPF